MDMRSRANHMQVKLNSGRVGLPLPIAVLGVEYSVP